MIYSSVCSTIIYLQNELYIIIYIGFHAGVILQILCKTCKNSTTKFDEKFLFFFTLNDVNLFSYLYNRLQSWETIILVNEIIFIRDDYPYLFDPFIHIYFLTWTILLEDGHIRSMHKVFRIFVWKFYLIIEK